MVAANDNVAAIVLGASRWERYEALDSKKFARAYLKSSSDILEYVKSENGLRVQKNNILSLFDSKLSDNDQDKRIRDFLRDRSASCRDLLIFFVGHGTTNSDGRFVFVLRSTEQERLDQTSYRMKDLAEALWRHAPLLRKWLFLDCCASAKAFGDLQPSRAVVDVLKLDGQDFPQRGTALFAACSADTVTHADLATGMTSFSGALLEALGHGDASKGPRLTLSEIAELTHSALNQRVGPRRARPELLHPDARAGELSRIPFFPNRAYDPASDNPTTALPRSLAEPAATKGVDAAAVYPIEMADVGGSGLLWRLQTRLVPAVETLSQLVPLTVIAALVSLLAVVFVVTPFGADFTTTLFINGSGSAHFVRQLILLMVASMWLSIQIWFWSHRTIVSSYGEDPTTWRSPSLLTWLPRVLAVVPFLFLAVGLVRAGESGGLVVALTVLIGWAVFALLVFRGTFLQRILAQPSSATLASQLARFSNLFAYTSVVAAFASVALVSIDPVGPAQTLGAAGVVFAAVGMAIPVIAVLIQALHRALRWPAILVLPLIAFLWGAESPLFGDAHPVGRRAFGSMETRALVSRPTFPEAFERWYAQAPAGSDGSKTMIVVAADGGTSRAAYWAACVLGELEQRSAGHFSKSLFAISSVGGGSVGSAAYLSQLRESMGVHPDFAAAVRGAADGDYLSPALAGLLFTDLPQAFLPRWPLAGDADFLPDRAEALEKAFERGWEDRCGQWGGCHDRHLWSRPYLSLWRSADQLWLPLLLINGSLERDGRRIVTAPIKVEDRDFAGALDFYVLTRREISVSTALLNGARYPIISPAGTLVPGRLPSRIVEGGRFDNTGVTTAADVVRAALEISTQTGKRIRPIIIRLDSNPGTALIPGTGMAAEYGGGPTSAMPINAIRDLISRHGADIPDLVFASMHLCHHIPVNWTLSRRAAEIIEEDLLSARCGNGTTVRAIEAELSVIPPTPPQ